jgi:hypothetical protein
VPHKNVFRAWGIEYRLRMVKPIGRDRSRQEDGPSFNADLRSRKIPDAAAAVPATVSVFQK